MTMTRIATEKTSGFTLTELAIVLLIAGLLLGGLLPVLSQQVEQRKMADTQQALNDIREALIGYALTRGSASKPYLPCPASNPDVGSEDRAGNGICNLSIGWLPWKDLGLGASDAWGNRYRYLASGNVTNSTNGIQLTSSAYSSTLKVGPTQEATPCSTVLADNLPVIVLSHGPNGYGARNTGGGNNAAPRSADESNNAAASPACIVSGTPIARDSPGEFDDQVVWLPFSLLASRLIAAGRLP